MGVTLVSLSLIVPSPPATLVVLTAELSPGERWDLATSHRAIASYKVTFGASFAASFAASLVHSVFGSCSRERWCATSSPAAEHGSPP
jgi:sulfate transport system permease protein